MIADRFSSSRPRRLPFLAGAGAFLLLVAFVSFVAVRVVRSPARQNRTHLAFTEEELRSQCPWLADTMAHWRQQAVATSGLPKFSDVGGFPVGNGRVFGIIGLQWPFGTVTNLIGPNYQKQMGFFGNLIPWVAVSGRPAEMPEQSVTWVRGAPVVCVTNRSPNGVEMQVFYAAHPDQPAIVFVAKVSNSARRVLRGVSFGLSSNVSAAEVSPDGLSISRGNVSMNAGLVDGVAQLRKGLAPATPTGLDRRLDPLGMAEAQTALYPLGSLGPGQSVVKIGYIAFTQTAQEWQDMLGVLRQSRLGMLEACRAAWEKWNEAVTTIATDQPRIDTFLEAQKYIVASQQAALGGFSPMDGYTYLWVRDSNGPLRFFSAIGALDNVKRHLEYHFRACATRGEVGNNVPLDAVLPRSIKPPDWDRVPVDAAEVPSFVILQHYWYYRASGDLTLIRWHWGMLRRCLLGQAVDAKGLLPFHGDETYRFPGYELFNAGRDIRDWVCLETKSADSAFEYVAAARALAEMASALGKGSEAAEYKALAARILAATEANYWQPDRGFYAPARSDFSDQVHRYPFANINLRPLWIGYGSAQDSRQQQNVLAALRHLWKPSGTVKTTPGCGYYVGMTPGYVLWNLAELRHPAARDALKGLLASAESGGGYAEMNTPEDRPAEEVWGQHRVRPWEGGINAEAVLYALTGYRPDAAARRAYLRPLLIAGKSLSVKHLPLGASSLDLRIMDERGKRRYSISFGGLPGKATVDLAVVVWGQGLRVTRVEAGNARAVKIRPGPVWPWAQEIVLAGLQVTPEHPACVTVEYNPTQPGTLSPAVPFDFGGATVPAGVRALVLTPSASQAQTQRQRVGGEVYCIDTKVTLPESYLRSALLVNGRPRVPLVVLDVERYPGAFKRANFWTDGAGARILKEFTAAGGRIEKVAKPSPPPKAYGGLVTLKG